MPSRDILQAYTDSASARMAEPITIYYNAIDRFGADSIEATVALHQARVDLEMAVRQNHIEAALIGAAGDMSPEQRMYLQELISTDMAYVERLADDLPSLSRAQALVRANMYVATARNTITEVATFDLPQLPIYPKSEQLECTWHCKCGLNVVYLYGNGNFNVYWQLDVSGGVEHCPDCLRLSASWRPLQIRAGQIVGVKMISDDDLARIKMLLEVA